MRLTSFLLCPLLLAGVACAQENPAQLIASVNPAARRAGTTVRIALVGDSTQTRTAGYGRGFCANFSLKVDCVDTAKGGASTRTFRDQGLWAKALATKPDYMVIQFGHNDNYTKAHRPNEVTREDYIANLKRFVTEARAENIKPVLVTPLTRRYYFDDGKIHSDLTSFCEAMRGVAKEMNVPLIELQLQSIATMEKLGPAATDKLAMVKEDKDGHLIFDKTHLNWAGSFVFGRMVAVDLGNVVPELKQYVLPQPAQLPAEGVKAVKVLQGAPTTIVLVGDSTVATEGGWGPGFCAMFAPRVKCLDDAKNGRSSKSFIDEGLWKKALADKGDYYLIQFGHNDEKADPARHTDPDTTFTANLERFIHDVRALGGVPVLVSPLARRTFVDGKPSNDDLKLYAEAARKVAEKEDVVYIDLLESSTRLLAKGTQEAADKFDAVGHPDAHADQAKAGPDRTHLNALGQKTFGHMVASGLVHENVELVPDYITKPGVVPGPPSPTVPTPMQK